MKRSKVRYCMMAVILLCLLFFTSCVHKSPFVSIEETYFQAMGDPSEFVITMDMEKGKPLYEQTVAEMSSIGQAMVDRADRLSVALYRGFPETEEELMLLPYPADLNEFGSYGAIEGDFSKFMINTALMYARQFETIRDGNVQYFQSKEGDFSIGMVRNGLLLFASEDWMGAYEKTWSNRELKIPADMALRMEQAMMGIYVASPRTMIDLGFDIPITVILQMDEAMFLISYDDQGSAFLDASIKMKSEKLANSLSMLIKSQYIAQLRRDGIKFSVSELANMLITEKEFFIINQMPLTSTQLESITQSFDSLIGTVGGML